MALTLTPEQQKALEQFDSDSDAATDAKNEATKSASDLLMLTDTNERNQAWAIEAQGIALQSGQAFIDAMLGKNQPSKPATSPPR